MYKKLLAASLLTLALSGAAFAQKKSDDKKSKKDKDESIIIRKNSDSKEKLTIVVDGDKVTVNGKPVEDLKDEDIEVIKAGADNVSVTVRPRAWALRPPLPPGAPGGAKFFEGDVIVNNKAFLGVGTSKDDKGAKITSVTKESAAEKSGLQKDDIITKVGDTKIEDADDLHTVIGKYNPEDKIKITYLRDGKEATTEATLQKNKSVNRHYNFNWSSDSDMDFEVPPVPDMPETPRISAYGWSRKPKVGLQVQDLEEGKGVKVLDVDSESPAAKAGLKENDIITELDGKELSNLDELKGKMRDLKEGDSFRVTYKRDGATQTTEVKLPKKLKKADL